jgi:hypothetical protein
LKQRLTYRSARDLALLDDLAPAALVAPLEGDPIALEAVPAAVTSIEELTDDLDPRCLAKALLRVVLLTEGALLHTDLSKSALLPESK